MLSYLIGELDELAAISDFELNMFIWDDAGAGLFHLSGGLHATKLFRYFRFSENKGKTKYWETIDIAFAYAKSMDWDYFMLLQDDIELSRDFFSNIKHAWYCVKEESSVLNLFTDPTRAGRSIWGQPMPEKLDDLGLWKCNWTDPMFFTDRRALEAIGFYMNPITEHSPTMGSKVGIQLSKRFNAAGVSIYQGIETFVHHGDHPSMMNPELRKQRPLVA